MARVILPPYNQPDPQLPIHLVIGLPPAHLVFTPTTLWTHSPAPSRPSNLPPCLQPPPDQPVDPPSAHLPRSPLAPKPLPAGDTAHRIFKKPTPAARTAPSTGAQLGGSSHVRSPVECPTYHRATCPASLSSSGFTHPNMRVQNRAQSLCPDVEIV